jgi:hypothetical protein
MPGSLPQGEQFVQMVVHNGMLIMATNKNLYRVDITDTNVDLVEFTFATVQPGQLKAEEALKRMNP